MTKKSNQGREKLWSKAKWIGFVNVTMTQQEKKWVKDNLLTEVSGYEFFMNAATAGYKIGISYSIAEDVYTVSLTGLYKQKPNAGLTMSLRHRDFIVAATALSWCLNEAGFDGSWAERFGFAGGDDW